MPSRYFCSHMSTVTDIPIDDLVRLKENESCSDCTCFGPNLWLCLQRGCLRIGCSENYNDHSTIHNRKCPSHNVHMNLSTQRIWCYGCQMEVFVRNGQSAACYDDSDTENDTMGTVAATSTTADSGLGSFGTLRTDSLDRRSIVGTPVSCSTNNVVFAFDKTVGLNVCMSGDSAGESSENEESASTVATDASKPRGLVGLQNIGNTCYMNAALQALSNTPPLTGFFLDCAVSVRLASEGRKPGLSRTYQRLVREMWHRKTRGYVVPSGILYGIRNVHSMFRGYHQHDTQEFLRCFMDQLHEELKQPIGGDGHGVPTTTSDSCETLEGFTLSVDPPTGYEAIHCDGANTSASQSEGEYETCDSGVSERSSLSDDTERSTLDEGRVGSGSKRRLSRSSSPGRRARLRSKLTSSPLLPSYRSSSPGVVIESQPSTSAASMQHAGGQKKPTKFRSIISDVFDGKLLSSVQCLTCDRISTRVETFQDLSLPIPNRDHLAVLHGTGLLKTSGSLQQQTAPESAGGRSAGSIPLTCTEAVYGSAGSQDGGGWMAWLWTWLKSWFYGPTVSLHDCLAAFFSADELKGDNMYSCEKCNKLRNGVKFSKVIDLPEVLCIHLKRFRHELMFSSKISSQVSFPLAGLDMRPYLHKEDCVSTVCTYDLISVICHHGTAGGGHYTAYCFNTSTDAWFEFDDQYVTQVTPDTVLGCEAYVLFYRKSNAAMAKCRDHTMELMEASPSEWSEMKFYVSRQWFNKLNTFAEPGPVDNSDLLCPHGGVHPDRIQHIDQLALAVTQSVWEYLYQM